ncbi:MAG: glycoside hydrolase family 3 C-terminal domain-containing protein, partial [Capsulimonadaceae bacterium]
MKLRTTLVLLGLLLIAAATTAFAQATDFSLYGDPVTVTVVAGSTAQYVVDFSPNGYSTAPAGYFEGVIELTASGLPAGATATFSPVAISGSEASILSVATTASTSAGSYTLTIAGASGSLAHTTTVVLTVVASASSESQAQQVINTMTEAQEISQISGTNVSGEYYETVLGISSLDIPTFNVLDGPLGPGASAPGHWGSAVAPPAPICLTATWDPTAAYTYGTTVGFQDKYFGNGLVHGPMTNINRVPESGRTYESLGEDPYLASQIIVQDALGIKSEGIMAQAKHMAGNNQEDNRNSVDDIIDERTLHEIYLPHFQAAVQQGDVGAIMCAYNGVNGYPSCGSPTLLSILKHDWGFTGFVESDYPATAQTSAVAGEDLEQPDANYFSTTTLEADVTAGLLPKSAIDDKVIRRFAEMMTYGSYASPPANQCAVPSACAIDSTDATTIENDVLPIAEEGTVLLKNTGILPFNLSKTTSVALIGPGATAAYSEGGGSSEVTEVAIEMPQAGMQSYVGSGVTVTTNDGGNLASAESLAASSSVVVVMVACPESEGSDLSTLDLPTITEADGTVNQDTLITSIAAENPNTVVVLNNGSPVTMPWLSSVPAIVEAWYPGTMEGYALPPVLFGTYNPSGHLPLTFMVNETDEPANTTAQYPGVNNVAEYSEGVFIGYRHYDENNLAVNFPFGFGLSYTTFGFSNLSITPTSTAFANNPNQTVTVSFTLKNTGSVTGADVAQVYVGMPNPSSTVIQPPKQLKGFQRESLTSGQSTPVTITLNQTSFSYWDVNSHAWQVVPGTYTISVGDSSRNIDLTGTVTITAAVTAAPTALTATGGFSQNIVSWTPSVGSTSYNVYRGTTSGGESATPIANVTTPMTYTDTAVTVGTTYYYKVAAVNTAGTSALSNEGSAAASTYVAPTGESPYGGTAWPVPGTIQAANYDLGGQGLAYNSDSATNQGDEYRTDGVGIEDTSDTGPGTYDVGWTAGGQWLNYTINVATAGSYTVGIRIASPNAGNVVDLRTPMGAALTGPVSVPETGGYQDWTTVNATCTLPAGQQVIQVFEDTGGYNLHYLTFTSGASAPSTPTNLTATAGNAQVSLSWTASSGATSYSVYRGTASGAESATAIASGVTTTSYTNTGLTNGTAYFYKVAAVNANGTSALSTEASATPSASTSSMVLGINCGGSATGSWVADEDFAGGSADTVTNTINTANVTNPAPVAVYQTNRFGACTYTIGGLTASTAYTVRLHFCETYFDAAGDRESDVSINGTQVLTNFDMWAAAGGENIANIQQFTETTNASGQFVIVFTTVINNAQINGIEIDSSSG